MAKKVILKDLHDVEILPITRGELILDSSGGEAFRSNLFLATDSLPGLMSKEDKIKLDKVDENGPTISLVSATVDGLAPKIGTAAASTVTTQADEWVLTSTKGATPTWRKLPTNAFLNYYRPILVDGTSLLGNNNTALNIAAGTNINLTTDAGKVTINNSLTKVSQLTNDSGYLTNDSLNNYVTLNTALTITGVKTFQSRANDSTVTIDGGHIRINAHTYGGWSRALQFGNTDTDSNNQTTTVNAQLGVYGAGCGTEGTRANKILYIYLSHLDLTYLDATLKVYNDRATITDNEIYHKGNLTKLSDLTDDILLGKYLPLSGGTMTGPITLTSGNSNAFDKSALSFISKTGVELVRIGTNSSNSLGIYAIGAIYLKPNSTFLKNGPGITLSSTEFTYNNYNILHEGNYSSYLGYIGTTAVLANSNALTLTGITDATMSGVTTTGTLVISKKTSDYHIMFSRGSSTNYPYNYIGTPAGGIICILPNGAANNSSEGMQFASDGLRPATTGAYSLGNSSKKWDYVYANTLVGNILQGKLHNIKSAVYQHSYVSGKWYRIMQTDSIAVADAAGELIIYMHSSGYPATIKLSFGISYHNTPFLICNWYTCWTHEIAKARIVYKTQYGNLKAYLEILAAADVNHETSFSFAGTGWSFIEPTETSAEFTESLNSKCEISITANNPVVYSSNITSKGFVKNDSSNSYVLLGGGDHKLVSDFALSSNLSNYVTLNTDQEITSTKTFTKQLKFTVAKGTAPFLVTSDTKVTNLNADKLDGYESSEFVKQITDTYESTTELLLAVNLYIGNHLVSIKSKSWGKLLNLSGLDWGTGLMYSLNIFNNTSSILGGGIWFNLYGTQAYLLKLSGNTSDNSITADRFITNSMLDSITVSSASTADKLKTKRKLWGRDFDGSSDITGSIYVGNTYVGNNQVIYGTDAEGNTLPVFYPLWSNGVTYLNYGPTAFHLRNKSSETVLYADSGKNIGIGTDKPSSKLDVNGNVKATSFIGNLDGTYVNKLTGYTKATAIAALAATDTLNTALGKLEYKADVAYDLVKGAYDGDGTIENLAEILKVLDGIKDTETIKAIVGKYLPLTGGTLTGPLTLRRDLYSGNYGLDLNNSDIINVNAIFTKDLANNADEGIQFSRGDNTYDSIWCKQGVFYFSPNGNADRNGTYSTNYTVLHSGNYNSYTPILNSSSTHATSSSVIYAPTSGGTSGQILKSNGTSAPTWVNLNTIAAKSALYLTTTSLNTEEDIDQTGLRVYAAGGSSWTGSITSMTYAAILTFGLPNRGWQMWCLRGDHSLHYRNGTEDSSGWNTERIILDSVNYVSYLGYIGTTAVQSSSAVQALTGITNMNMTGNITIECSDNDRFLNFYYNSGNSDSWRIGYLGTGSDETNYLVFQSNSKDTGKPWTNALRFGCDTLDAAFGGNVYPLATNTKTLGTSSLRWNNIYSVLGNFSGNLTLYKSDGGDSPHLVFLRGTTSDGSYDWRIYDAGGSLKFQYCNADVWTEILSLYSNGITSTAFIKSGGTSSQFLKADGSVDSNTYLTSHLSLANYVTLNGALTISGVKTFSTLLKFTVAQGTSPFTVTSNTKVGNLNADFLDDYHVTSLVRKSEMANNSSFNANNMTTDLVIYTSKGDVGSNASVWDNFGASKPSGGFSLFHIKEGVYARQLLGVYNDRHLYTRSQYYSNGTVWSSWSTIALTSDIPKITDYYWANINISSTSSTTTTPTFGNTKINTLTITSTDLVSHLKFSRGTYNYITTPSGGYLGFVVNGGSMSSDNCAMIIKNGVIYSGSNNISALGRDANRWTNIYSTLGNFSDNITAAGFIKSNSSDSYVLLGGGGHKAISDFLLKSEIDSQELYANLTTITKELTVTADWMDTGIAYNNLPSNGTYIVLVCVQANDGTGQMYDCYWSGVMTWFVTGNSSNKTNDSETDEILLHRSGHAYANTIYLRTVMTSYSSGEGLKLLIAANKNLGAAYTYTFKFKRII